MEERVKIEMEMLRTKYPNLEISDDGNWIHIPSYSLPNGWNLASTGVAFQIPVSYPGTPPYGIYAPVGLLFQEERPKSYTDPAPTQPPFPGTWGIFSWAPSDGQWLPKADPVAGSNLLNWVRGFTSRFREGI
jgi:hypothetical protein